MNYDVAILGAGAAGMMAAVAAGEHLHGTGKSIAIFERNLQPGIKILVCGGGRCNFTNAGTVDFLIGQFGRNGRFLTPALTHLDNEALRDFFAALHVPSHVEHDGKVYPDSNQARSVVDALIHRMKALNVAIYAGPSRAIASIERAGPSLSVSAGQSSSASSTDFLLTTTGGEVHTARIVVLAAGGMSYQRMGTLGDGYRIAGALGHTTVTPRPAIVGLLIKEEWGKMISGLAVRDVEVRIVVEGTLPRLATGKPTPSVNDMLFTHFGLSGPAILNISEIIAELLEKFPTVTIRVDFARHITHENAHALLRSWQQRHGKKLLRKVLSQHASDITITSTSPDKTHFPSTRENPPSTMENLLSIPIRLAEKILELEQIPTDQPCATLTSGQIHRLVERVKNCLFTVYDTRGFKEAMVTAGGIKLSEVNPHTLESKITPNLFLTGEVLDLTGPSGGYNLQLAFSTGHLAGTIIGNRLQAEEGRQ